MSERVTKVIGYNLIIKLFHLVTVDVAVAVGVKDGASLQLADLTVCSRADGDFAGSHVEI